MTNLKSRSPFTIFPSRKPGELKHRIVVSKKVSKKAVERNLIKRRITSILQTTPLQKPLVIVCHPVTQGLSFSELQAALLHHLKPLSV